jgi:uncharacterized protein YndB with AHSA1/START domain
MESLIVQNSVQIHATPARVWDCLTRSDLTAQYMFGCRADTDWKVGSPILWKGSMGAQERVFVSGHIKRIEKEKALEYTTFDPNGKLEDIPSNYLTVVYTLTPKDGGTYLEVSQGDFTGVADSEKRYQDTLKGWAMVLPKIKELAEKE